MEILFAQREMMPWCLCWWRWKAPCHLKPKKSLPGARSCLELNPGEGFARISVLFESLSKGVQLCRNFSTFRIFQGFHRHSGSLKLCEANSTAPFCSSTKDVPRGPCQLKWCSVVLAEVISPQVASWREPCGSPLQYGSIAGTGTGSVGATGLGLGLAKCCLSWSSVHH